MKQAEVRRRQAQAISIILTLITLAVVARLTGYNGVVYVVAALETLAAVWVVIVGNLSDVLGRLIRVRNAKGRQRSASMLRKNTLLFQAVLGLAGSVALLLCADWIARVVFRVQYSTFILMVLAPSLFLKSLSAVLLGCFQGDGTELPTAVAALLRQIFILGFSLLFGKMLGNYGHKVSNLLGQENFSSMYGGVGVAIAVSVTEFFVLIFLFVIYRGSRRTRDPAGLDGMRAADSFMDSVRILWGGRGIQWVTGLLVFLPVPLGLVFLQKSGGGDATVSAYGVYAAGYWVLCGIWTALIMATMVPVNVRTVIFLRREEIRYARTTFQSGIHIGVAHAAFASSFLIFMAPQLSQVFCAAQAQAAEQMLRAGGVAVLFLLLSLYFTRFLNLTGGKLYVLGAVGASDVVYVVTVTVMLNVGRAGVMALVYGGVLGLGVSCVILGIFAARQLRFSPDWLQVAVLPVGAAGVVGVIGMMLGRVLTPHLGNLVMLAVALAVSCFLYWMILLLLRNFKEQELEVIPGGRLIRAMGQTLRVY